MRKLFWAFLALLAALGLYLFVLPGPVDAVAWTPPPAPTFAGNTAVNDSLKRAQLLGLGEIHGAEDVAVDAAGRVYGGTADGRIVRLLPDGSRETFATTGGRPLGLDWDPQGRLIVADAQRGLLAISTDGDISVLATGTDDQPFGFTDDLDVASDGRIYFSDASSKYNTSNYALDLLESRPYGRLLVHDPADGSTRVLLDKLYFANGVALSEREDFVLVNETWRYRIVRYWLKGPRAGQHDMFVENLPGFPDGVSANGRGSFWVAMPSPRKQDVDKMYPKPWLKNLVARLPAWLHPEATPYGLVLKLDEAGTIVASFHDPDGTHLREITSVEEHAGAIYLGTLTNDRIGRLPLP